MSVAERVPYDFLGNTGYRLFIQRLPKTSFSVQTVTIPGLTLPAIAETNPFVNIPKAGDHIMYNEFSVNFLVDGHLRNYMEIYNWIKDLGKPSSFWQYTKIVSEPGTGVASDINLMVLDAKKNPKLKVTFKSAIPISLSDLVFDATTSDLIYLGVTAKFAYVSFEITTDF